MIIVMSTDLSSETLWSDSGMSLLWAVVAVSDEASVLSVCEVRATVVECGSVPCRALRWSVAESDFASSCWTA